MKITDSSVRKVVASVVVFILIGLGYAQVVAKKQDSTFAVGYNAYRQAISLLKEDKFEQALPLLKHAEEVDPDSAKVKQYLGISLANTGELTEATKKYKKVMDLNPYIIEDSLFMLQFGEILSLAGQANESLLVLEHCKTLPTPKSMPDYQEKVTALIEQAKANT